MKIVASRGKLIVTVLGVVGICALVLGCLILGLFETILGFFMQKELTLKPGKEFYDIWRNVPLPVYQNIYMFNITNPGEFEKGEKPILEEIGPYVFRGRWKKENIHWNDDEGTVTYKDIKEYEFAPELSTGDQEEMIYTLNGPLLAAINYAEDSVPRFLRPFMVDIMNNILDGYNETLLVHKTVREMLYEGYYEPMIADLVPLVEEFVTLPVKLINNTFGILHERKHIGDGEFTVKSGIEGLEDFTEIKMWNNQSSFKWWYGDACNKVSGTDGIQFAPGITKNETLFMFNPTICRSIPLTYEKDSSVHGIKTLRFGFPDNALGTGEENPDNKCYCKEGDHCRSGIITLNCKKGAPYVISLPHFFNSDPKLQEGVIGMNASSERHKTFFHLQARTGFALGAAVKIQLNGVIRQLPDYKALGSVRENIVPVLWISEEATIDEHFANYFKSRMQTPLIAFRAILISAIAVGAVWTVSSILFLLWIKVKVKSESQRHSVDRKTTNSVYKCVALCPPEEEKTKDINIAEKESFIK